MPTTEDEAKRREAAQVKALLLARMRLTFDERVEGGMLLNDALALAVDIMFETVADHIAKTTCGLTS